MGTRYILDKNCVFCEELNEDIYYAPTSNFYTFTCTKCRRVNFIKSDFKVIKKEQVKLKDIKVGFIMTTMGTLTDKEIDNICKSYYKRLKGGQTI